MRKTLNSEWRMHLENAVDRFNLEMRDKYIGKRVKFYDDNNYVWVEINVVSLCICPSKNCWTFIDDKTRYAVHPDKEIVIL